MLYSNCDDEECPPHQAGYTHTEETVQQKMKGVLSIDLASKNYGDFGFAYLSEGSQSPEFIHANQLDLQGKPLPGDCAFRLDEYSRQKEISVLILDGPQGWKSPNSGVDHMRLCERVLNTPAKTGVIGMVKPSPALRFVAFSISLFHSLRVDFGWQLLTEDWFRDGAERWIVEGFPTSAWKTLGLDSLPAKSKTKQQAINRWTRELQLVTGLNLPDSPSHDQLQAAAMLPAARAIVHKRPDQVILSGMDPIITRNSDVLEGWIANPRIAETKDSRPISS
jgi:hypothetical protein